MSTFVIDNSIAMRWHLPCNKPSDQKYAEAVLASLAKDDAVVPNLWHLEAANVLAAAERQGNTTTIASERFIAQLERLPIHVDQLSAHYAFTRVLALARAYRLSSYDAAYLELAIREGLALATLDKQLSKAAKKAGIPSYLK